MRTVKNVLGNLMAFSYFLFPMFAILLVMLFSPLFFLTEVSSMRDSGFAGPGSAEAFIGACGLCIGISLLIPYLRRMYRALPWLFSFVKIMYINVVILMTGTLILRYGYEVNDEARHSLYFLLMIAFTIVCRLIMCIYFKLRPAIPKKEG